MVIYNPTDYELAERGPILDRLVAAERRLNNGKQCLLCDSKLSYIENLRGLAAHEHCLIKSCATAHYSKGIINGKIYKN